MNVEAFISGFNKRAEEEGMDKNAFLLPLLATIGSTVGGGLAADALGSMLARRALTAGTMTAENLAPALAKIKDPVKAQEAAAAWNKAHEGINLPNTPTRNPDALDWLAKQHITHSWALPTAAGMVAPAVTDPIVQKLLEPKKPAIPQQQFTGYPDPSQQY